MGLWELMFGFHGFKGAYTGFVWFKGSLYRDFMPYREPMLIFDVF